MTTEEQLADARAKLAEAESGFDTAYQYSDDYSYWSRQREKWELICAYRKRIAQLEAQ